MTVSQHPWFRFWAAAWLADESVSVMSLASRGAYIHLLAYQWREGSIPSDSSAIAKLLGEPCPADVLANFSTRKDGRLVNIRLEKERDEKNKFSKSRAIAGKNGAKKRWLSHSSTNGSAIGLPMANDSYSESESDVEEKKRDALARSLFHEFELARLANVHNAKHLRPTPANVKHIAARLAEGSTADDVRHVIASCVRDVRGGGDQKWFNPSAAFRPDNFARHLATDVTAPPRPVAGARPEPAQRQYEDLGDMFARIGGES